MPDTNEQRSWEIWVCPDCSSVEAWPFVCRGLRSKAHLRVDAERITVYEQPDDGRFYKCHVCGVEHSTLYCRDIAEAELDALRTRLVEVEQLGMLPSSDRYTGRRFPLCPASKGEAVSEDYLVFATAFTGDVERCRMMTTDKQAALNRALRIASRSGEEGAISVWISRGGEPIWAAGEKAQALEEAGYKLDDRCNVLP